MEYVGEAHQGAADIEGREGFTHRDDLADSELILEEFSQPRLTQQEDFPATCGDHRDVADEVDRVAQALLGDEEDSAALQGASVPEGIEEFAVEVHRFDAVADF